MKTKVFCAIGMGCLLFSLCGMILVSIASAQQKSQEDAPSVVLSPHDPQAALWKLYSKALWDSDHDTGIQSEESPDEDCLRFDIEGREIMIIDDAGNVGIGEAPPTNTCLYVKSRMEDWQYAIYGEGMQGVRGVSNAYEGTGVTGEGGHAGVSGTGFIGLLGTGFYGGWFEGHGVFTGNLGVGTTEPESKLHVSGAINLDPTAEPANPTVGFILYCDSADGKLKAKSSAGSITVLADS